MSILHSHSVNYTKALTQMKKLKEDNSSNPSLKSSIENYIDYITSMELISKNDYEKARSSMLNIGGRLPNNAMLVNNIAVLDILSNKVDDGFNAMLNVVGKSKMNSMNDITYSNMVTVSDMFGKKIIVD